MLNPNLRVLRILIVNPWYEGFWMLKNLAHPIFSINKEISLNKLKWCKVSGWMHLLMRIDWFFNFLYFSHCSALTNWLEVDPTAGWTGVELSLPLYVGLRPIIFIRLRGMLGNWCGRISTVGPTMETLELGTVGWWTAIICY